MAIPLFFLRLPAHSAYSSERQQALLAGGKPYLLPQRGVAFFFAVYVLIWQAEKK
jgi:hypothetical protein